MEKSQELETVNIPFMRRPGQPPLHLRTWTPEEFDTYERMYQAHRAVHAPRTEPDHPADTTSARPPEGPSSTSR